MDNCCHHDIIHHTLQLHIFFQVADKFELLAALKKLLSDANFLDACCMASKHAFSIVSNGVVERVWELVDTIVLEKAKGRLEEH